MKVSRFFHSKAGEYQAEISLLGFAINFGESCEPSVAI